MRRGVVGADGDRRSAAGVGDAGGAGQRGDVVKADHLAECDGGDVERVSEGVGGGDHAADTRSFEVAWGVGLAAVVEHEGGGVVVELGESGEDAAVAEGQCR